MNITQLHYFKTAVQENSYAEAAKKLYVTSQAVSKAINELERELEIPLFEKNGRGVKPTAFAIDFAAQAANVLSDFNRLSEYAYNYKSNRCSSGIVNLAIASAGARGELVTDDDLANFRISHPNISINPQHHASEICLSAFIEELVEAAVVLGDYRAPGVSCTKITTFSPFLLVGRNHPLAKMQIISLYSLNEMVVARPIDMRYVYRTLTTKLEMSASKPKFVSPPLDQTCYQDFFDTGGTMLVAKSTPLLSRLSNVELLPFCKESNLEFSLYCIKRKENTPSAAVTAYIQSISTIIKNRLS